MQRERLPFCAGRRLPPGGAGDHLPAASWARKCWWVRQPHWRTHRRRRHHPPPSHHANLAAADIIAGAARAPSPPTPGWPRRKLDARAARIQALVALRRSPTGLRRTSFSVEPELGRTGSRPLTDRRFRAARDHTPAAAPSPGARPTRTTRAPARPDRRPAPRADGDAAGMAHWSTGAPPTSPLVMAWGHRPAAMWTFARHGHRPLIRIGDGFLRSVELGSRCPPLSIVIDDLGGIHYDPQPRGWSRRSLRSRATARAISRHWRCQQQWVEARSRRNTTPYATACRALRHEAAQ